MFAAEQAAAGVFLLKERRAFSEKVRFWVPKPCLRLNRLPQALFLLKNDMPFFRKECSGQKLTILYNILSIFDNVWSIFSDWPLASSE